MLSEPEAADKPTAPQPTTLRSRSKPTPPYYSGAFFRLVNRGRPASGPLPRPGSVLRSVQDAASPPLPCPHSIPAIPSISDSIRPIPRFTRFTTPAPEPPYLL